jgi:hypothetical protein
LGDAVAKIDLSDWNSLKNPDRESGCVAASAFAELKSYFSALSMEVLSTSPEIQSGTVEGLSTTSSFFKNADFACARPEHVSGIGLPDRRRDRDPSLRILQASGLD